jgi:hypothetical protein
MSETRRDLVRIGAPVHTWAGVVVLGDGDRVPFPSRATLLRRPSWTAVILIAIALGGAVVLRRRSGARPRGESRALAEPARRKRGGGVETQPLQRPGPGRQPPWLATTLGSERPGETGRSCRGIFKGGEREPQG